MAVELRVQKCVACGQFMNCEGPDAHCEFTPDSDHSIEAVEWTCGTCRRRQREDRGRERSDGC